jgi:hypothetical protein
MTARWHLPPELRPAEQPETMSVDARLVAAKVALVIVEQAADPARPHPRTGRRWPQRERLEYIRTICDNVLRRIR